MEPRAGSIVRGDGDRGGLVVARAAGGVRFANHFVVEVGYGAYALGGSVDSGRLEEMKTDRMPGEPQEAISGGEARGLIDISLGVTL